MDGDETTCLQVPSSTDEISKAVEEDDKDGDLVAAFSLSPSWKRELRLLALEAAISALQQQDMIQAVDFPLSTLCSLLDNKVELKVRKRYQRVIRFNQRKR